MSQLSLPGPFLPAPSSLSRSRHSDKSECAGGKPALMTGRKKIPPEILIYNGNSAAFLRRRFQLYNDDP
ncbi:MAG: hypothetical protein DUW69_000235 [Verrucomicrobia bacterium]|jgi:hypothetical protein|nr:MAG: hypothetical protein DUW69_000235 [Verrucomicrobiota bacterium]